MQTTSSGNPYGTGREGYLRLKAILLKRVIAHNLSSTLSVNRLKDEEEIIKLVQSRVFHSELATLRKEASGRAPKRDVCSAFRKLNPVLFEGVLRVGGRLSKAQIEFAVKHPIILPTSHHVPRPIVEEHHKAVGHSGMSHTWSSLRQRYWILKGAATIRKIFGIVYLVQKSRPSLFDTFRFGLRSSFPLGSGPLKYPRK